MRDTEFLLIVIVLALLAIALIVGSHIKEKEDMEAKRKYDTVVGCLNDACHNMIDYYDLPDSIYNHYLEVIEEQGFDKNEIKHSYFCY